MKSWREFICYNLKYWCGIIIDLQVQSGVEWRVALGGLGWSLPILQCEGNYCNLLPPPSSLQTRQHLQPPDRAERERDVRRTGQRKLYGGGSTEDLFLQRNLINVWRIIIFKETWYSVARHWCDVRLAISAPFTSLQVILEMRFANFLWNFNKEGEQTGVEPAASQSGCLDLE